MAKTLNDAASKPKPVPKPKTTRKPVAEDPAVNSIQFVTDEPSPSGRAKRGQKTAHRTDNTVELADSKPASLFARLPDSVMERFVKIGNQFYFPDGAEAFSWEKDRLTTRSENAVVIQSMVAIAREESAKGIVKVTGTDFFRKEAWFAASLAGLKVDGYKPSDFERDRLVRALARRAAPAAGSTASAPEKTPGVEASPPQPGGNRSKSSAEVELIVGKLVDHGPAPYQHNPKEAMSYFVRIETAQGDREVWGVDLERAFRHSLSRPGIGDEVGLRAVGREAVTVPVVKQTPDGQELRQELNTHRNQWSVERKDFLDERRAMSNVFRDPSITASEGTRRHPGLEGSYFQLQMGQAITKEQSGSKLHRDQFVEHLREHLARGIEHGQPLEAVRLRVKEDRSRDARTQDRDYNPTR